MLLCSPLTEQTNVLHPRLSICFIIQCTTQSFFDFFKEPPFEIKQLWTLHRAHCAIVPIRAWQARRSTCVLKHIVGSFMQCHELSFILIRMNSVVRESNCFVPGCINSSTSDSGKLFFPLPRETSARSNWCVTVGLSPSSTHSTSHCCEDHFNVSIFPFLNISSLFLCCFPPHIHTQEALSQRSLRPARLV